MATISYKICDRCKEKIHSDTFKKATVRRKPEQPKKARGFFKNKQSSRFKFYWRICGYVTESEKELCGKCTADLGDFLDGKPLEKEN